MSKIIVIKASRSIRRSDIRFERGFNKIPSDRLDEKALHAINADPALSIQADDAESKSAMSAKSCLEKTP